MVLNPFLKYSLSYNYKQLLLVKNKIHLHGVSDKGQQFEASAKGKNAT